MEKQTFVTFVLDETGSMESIKDDTIGGFNQYLSTLKQKGNALFTLIKFDSNRTEVVHRAVPIEQALELNTHTYQPGACTPLIDACFKAILATEVAVAERDVNVAVVIQTDGYENASTQYTNDALNRLIKEKSAKGWLFLFLGANMDAFAQASQFGISGDHTIAYTQSGPAFGSAGRITTSYMTSGVAGQSIFTNTDRAAAGTPVGVNQPSTTVPPPTESADSVVDDITI